MFVLAQSIRFGATQIKHLTYLSSNVFADGSHTFWKEIKIQSFLGISHEIINPHEQCNRMKISKIFKDKK